MHWCRCMSYVFLLRHSHSNIQVALPRYRQTLERSNSWNWFSAPTTPTVPIAHQLHRNIHNHFFLIECVCKPSICRIQTLPTFNEVKIFNCHNIQGIHWAAEKWLSLAMFCYRLYIVTMRTNKIFIAFKYERFGTRAKWRTTERVRSFNRRHCWSR